MKEFSLGFVFDKDQKKILLVHKQKPEWQAGKINGIGGKIEVDETPVACISRETKEEACLDIPEDEWIFLGLKSEQEATIHIFTTMYQGDISDAQKGDYEDVEWFPIDQLPKNCIPNLWWMIPFAQEQTLGIDPGTFHVTSSSIQ